jgi:hypothetical protein
MVAQKGLIISSREINRAELSVSSEINTLPGRFLLNIRPFKVWRAQSIVGEYIIVELETAKAINSAAFVNPNFSTVQFYASATLSGLATPSFDSGEVSIWPAGGKPVDEDHAVFTGIARFTNPTTYKFWKILLSDFDVGATNAELGRLLLDTEFQFERGIDTSFGMEIASRDELIITDFNSVFAEERGLTTRNYVFPISAVAYDDVKDYLYKLARYSGKSKDFVFCANPGADDDWHIMTVHALFAESVPFKLQSMWHNSKRTWNVALALKEIQ